MSRYVGTCTWSDVPHLSQEQQDTLLASIPPYQRDARSKGVPQLGSGAIYPVPESEIVVNPIEIPHHWPRAYGMDVGWNRTACVWGARDPEADVVYLYSEHYKGQAEPVIHVQGIKGRGEWITGAIDPASRGRGQAGGEQLLQNYRDLGLNLVLAENGVEAGLFDVWQRMSAGKLKVFKSLQSWLGEYRLYRRDEKGNVVKSNDHLMDATRYLLVTGINVMQTAPDAGQKLLRQMNAQGGRRVFDPHA